MTIQEIKQLRETEDKVEFKEAKKQYNYGNGRRSVLGYVVALANEEGGKLIFGVKENKHGLHEIVGSLAWEGHREVMEDLVKAELIHSDKQNQSKYKLSGNYEDITKGFLAQESEKTGKQKDSSESTEVLHDTHKEILNLIIQNNAITRRELSERLNIAPSAVQKHLKRLVEDGFIKREGKTKASYWIIINYQF